MSDVVDVSAVVNHTVGSVITMRTFTMGDNTKRVSAIDLIKAVLGQNNNKARETIRKIQKECPEFFETILKFKFKGSGQVLQYVLCLSECVMLMLKIPGSATNEFCIPSGPFLTHLFAGDPTLHPFIVGWFEEL
jgi:hypothetical protein